MSSVSLARTAPAALTDKQVYTLLLAATFAVFLVAVIVQRLGRALAGHPVPATRSIFAEARETGSNTLLLAFTG